MVVLKEQILEQIDTVLADADGVLEETAIYVSYHYDGPTPAAVWDTREQCRTRVIATLERLAPPASAYVANISPSTDLSALVSRLRALRVDLDAGYTQRLEELLNAEVFGDFLEMAEELHGKGYKDPAAVITGTVLEEHLRKLSAKHGVATEIDGKRRKAESLNEDLKNQGVYNLLDQKSVTAWLDLRNKAAHGEYDQYDSTQVDALIRDVRSFLSRNPA